MRNRILSYIVVLLVSCITVAVGKPGEGIDIGKVIVRPYVDGSVTHDSNPYLSSTNVKSDVFFEYEIGADLLYRARNLNVYGSLYAFARNYSDDEIYENDRQYDDDLDFSGFGESLGLTYGRREKLQLRARQSYQEVTDYSKEPYNDAFIGEYRDNSVLSEDRGDRTDRNLLNATVELGRDLTDKTELDLGYHFSQVDYVYEGLFDTDQSDMYGEFAYQVTDKSAAFIFGEYGIESSDGFTNDLNSTIVRFGWKTLVTEKTIFKGSIGIQFYDTGVDDAFLESKKNELQKLNIQDGTVNFESKDEWVSFDLNWKWMPTDKLTFDTFGGNGASASSYEELNVRKTTLLGSSAKYKFTPAFKGWIGVAYRQDEYSRESLIYNNIDKTYSLIARKSDFLGGELGVEFAPPQKWYSVYAKTTMETTDSNIDTESFDQIRVSLGGKLIY